MNTTFTTSERTEKFIVALQKIEEAESAVLDAMSESYGEEQGFEMTGKLGFDNLNDEVLRCMRIAILGNLRDTPTTI